jgi:hypothetical protein
VIVRLRTDFVPEGRLDRIEAADQRDEIQGARAGLQEDLGGTGYQIAREFKTVPFVALEASPRALETIQRSPLATDAAATMRRTSRGRRGTLCRRGCGS